MLCYTTICARKSCENKLPGRRLMVLVTNALMPVKQITWQRRRRFFLFSTCTLDMCFFLPFTLSYRNLCMLKHICHNSELDYFSIGSYRRGLQQSGGFNIGQSSAVYRGNERSAGDDRYTRCRLQLCNR